MPEIESSEYDTINEFTVAGEFGYQRINGPFEAVKDGTVWGIVVPIDAHPTVSTLPQQTGEAAVIIADGTAVGGGILSDVLEKPSHDEYHVLIDQYGLGDV